jgi:hypothetical protein
MTDTAERPLQSHVLGRVVDEVVRAELAGERLLVGTACDRDGAEAELVCELHPEMAEAADTQDRDLTRHVRRRSLLEGCFFRHRRRLQLPPFRISSGSRTEVRSTLCWRKQSRANPSLLKIPC